MGIPGRFRREDVLDDEKVKLLQGRLGPGHVGIAEDGIFPHDVHGADLAGPGRLHHLQDREPPIVGQGSSPLLFKKGPHLLLRNPLVAGEVVGKGPHITSSLDVVLTPERIDARGWTAHIPGQHGKIGQAGHVGGAGGMLGDPHGVEDGGPFGACVEPRRLDDVLWGNPRHRRDLCRGIVGEDRGQLREPFAPLFDELPIVQPFAHDHMHHPQIQGHIRPRGQLQEKVGLFREIRPAGVDDNESRSPPLGLVEPKADDRMGFEGVGADNQDELRLFQLRDGIGGRPAPEGVA